METDVQPRIDTLAQRDRLLAILFTVALWAVLIFVYIAAAALAPTTSVAVVALVSVLVLGSFNTASMIALVRRYALNKDLIYRQDVVMLDRIRAAREEQRR